MGPDGEWARAVRSAQATDSLRKFERTRPSAGGQTTRAGARAGRAGPTLRFPAGPASRPASRTAEASALRPLGFAAIRSPVFARGRGIRARSSAVGHYRDMVGVTVSIPVAPTSRSLRNHWQMSLLDSLDKFGLVLGRAQNVPRIFGFRSRQSLRPHFCE